MERAPPIHEAMGGHGFENPYTHLTITNSNLFSSPHHVIPGLTRNLVGGFMESVRILADNAYFSCNFEERLELMPGSVRYKGNHAHFPMENIDMYIKNEDTICAPATVPGTGAISVIRVSGPEALAIADKVVRCARGTVSEAAGYTVKFGTVVDFRAGRGDGSVCEGGMDFGAGALRGSGGDSVEACGGGLCEGDSIEYLREARVIDEVLVSVFRAPHSYTGEDSVEISCHASSYIVSAIMDLLCAEGCRAAGPGEFTERAFLNGKMDLAQAEAVADVIASQNAAAHRVAFSQMKGGFSSELRSMRAELLEIVSLMELELDFSEEEVEFADRSRLDSLLAAVIGHVGRLIDSFRLGNAIKNGVPVAIAGATNTGKSTLLNALLGEERAIVSDVHGTTRDTIEETLNIDGVLFRFIDTAGIRETSEVVEKIGIERTYRKISEASLVLGMIDLSRGLEENCEMVSEILGKVDLGVQKVIFVLNKVDLAGGPEGGFVGCFDGCIAGRFGGCSGGDSGVNKNVQLINYIVSFVDSLGYKAIWGDSGVVSGGDIAILPISAKTGAGISDLRALLASTQRDLLEDLGSAVLVTNQRHVQALSDARDSLSRVRSGLAGGLPTDLAAQDIREAIYHLGSIIGEISTDEVLGNIFRNFCIGK